MEHDVQPSSLNSFLIAITGLIAVLLANYFSV